MGLKIRKVFLESFGYTVEIANSGVAALDAAAKNHFDVAILDYRMPDMNGLDVARNLKKRFPDLPLIVLSGHSAEFPAELHGLVSGYVAKGSHPDVLLQRLAEVVGPAPRRKRESPPQRADLLAGTKDHLEESKRQVQKATEATARAKRGGRRRTA